MAKVGRNEPCPCGSGKKYKKCCYGKDAPASNGSTSSANTSFDPRMMAQALMQMQEGPQKSQLSLVMDRFKVNDPQALEQAKKLGQVSEQSVMFYQGKKWVGELDLSIEGEAILTTADLKQADKICAKLKKISGLDHVDRKQDTFDNYEPSDPKEIAREMLDFKSKFFLTWMDEKNDRLDGSTPRQAAKSPKLKKKLLTLIEELEEREARLDKKERYSFKSIRRELGL